MTNKKIGKIFLTLIIASVITISQPFMANIRASELLLVNTSVVNALPTITSIDKIFQTTYINDKYILPKTAIAIMSDGSSKSVAVKWSTLKVTTATTSNYDIFTYTGTVTGYSSKVNLELTVIKIASIEDISQNVYINDSYTLPKTITAKMGDESTKSVAVKWSPSRANTSKAGDFIYTGTVAGYSSKVSLILKVIPITLIDPISEIVYINDSYTLPQTVTAKMGDETTKTVTVKWSPAKATTSKAGDFIYTGIVTGYSSKVNLILKVIPIKAIKETMGTIVNVNDSYTLPKTVTATMRDKDESTKSVAVTWSPSKANTSKAGVFTYTGTVAGYSNKIYFTLDVNPLTLIVETVNLNGSYSLPMKATAIMSNGIKVKGASIAWDNPIVDTRKLGTFTYMGTFNGYINRVKLTLKVEEGITIKSANLKAIVKPSDSRIYNFRTALSISESDSNDPIVNGIRLSELISNVVRLDLNNVAGTTYNSLYIDYNEDGNYDKETDHIVGQFTIIVTGDFENVYTNIIDGIKVVSGDKGTITFRVYNADATKVRAYTSVSVNL